VAVIEGDPSDTHQLYYLDISDISKHGYYIFRSSNLIPPSPFSPAPGVLLRPCRPDFFQCRFFMVILHGDNQRVASKIANLTRSTFCEA